MNVFEPDLRTGSTLTVVISDWNRKHDNSKRKVCEGGRMKRVTGAMGLTRMTRVTRGTGMTGVLAGEAGEEETGEGGEIEGQLKGIAR